MEREEAGWVEEEERGGGEAEMERGLGEEEVSARMVSLTSMGQGSGEQENWEERAESEGEREGGEATAV